MVANIAQTAYTKPMKIYLGSDHRGFALKEKVFAYLAKSGYAVEDVGGRELNPDDDFPQFAAAAALRVIGDGEDDPRAILICGGGQGMCMAANRFKGIRASVIWDAHEARMTRRDNTTICLRVHTTTLCSGLHERAGSGFCCSTTILRSRQSISRLSTYSYRKRQPRPRW